MHGLLQPTHVFFILLIVLILFGPAKLQRLGKGLGRSINDFRGVPSPFRNAVFMAKGVDPKVGRDVGDMLPDEHAHRLALLYRFLLAILIGNTLYFLISPLLPGAAHLGAGAITGLPVVVDLWVCLMVFGILSQIQLPSKRK